MNEVINVNKKELQYYHANNFTMECNYGYYEPSYTATLEMPTKDELIFLLNYRHMEKNLRLTMKLGVSYLNPTDNYCKDTGRKLSSSRLEPIEWELTNVNFMEKKTFFTLCSIHNELIQLQIHQNSKHVYFLSYKEPIDS